MKLITTLFTGEQIEASLNISPRNKQGEDPDAKMVTRYRSKIGNESLIFNPYVSVILKPRGKSDKGNVDAMIPLSMFYRFAASLQAVYQGLQTPKLYRLDEGVLYIDHKIAMEKSRRLSLFKNSLSLVPCAIHTRADKPVKGIEFVVDKTSIGAMAHYEILCMVDLIDHFDMVTYSLVAGVIDEMEAMNVKLDRIEQKLDRALAPKSYSGPRSFQPNRSPAEDLSILSDPSRWNPLTGPQF